jgi:hypothetical protein
MTAPRHRPEDSSLPYHDCENLTFDVFFRTVLIVLSFGFNGFRQDIINFGFQKTQEFFITRPAI